MTRTKRPWSLEETALLGLRYPAEGASPEVQAALGRSVASIHGKARELGLVMTEEGVSRLKVRLARGGGAAHWNFRGHRLISAGMIVGLRRHAIERGLDCPLLDGTIESYEYLHSLVTLHCPLSGLPLVFPPSRRKVGTISLDRIDSQRGYVRGNVRWVHKTINRMRWDLSDDTFLSFVCDIVKTHPKLS